MRWEHASKLSRINGSEADLNTGYALEITGFFMNSIWRRVAFTSITLAIDATSTNENNFLHSTNFSLVTCHCRPTALISAI